MHIGRKQLGLLAAMSCLGVSFALAANGSWKFGTEDRGHPELSYSDNNGMIFLVGCGHAFAIHAVYPGAPKKVGEKAAITIANATNRMNFTGEIESGEGLSYPSGTTGFVQWDLGYARQNPDLYEKKWKQLESRLFDLLDAGQKITVSAQGYSYVLPPINVRKWKSRFKKIC
jgi:hypothetical protein